MRAVAFADFVGAGRASATPTGGHKPHSCSFSFANGSEQAGLRQERAAGAHGEDLFSLIAGLFQPISQDRVLHFAPRAHPTWNKQ